MGRLSDDSVTPSAGTSVAGVTATVNGSPASSLAITDATAADVPFTPTGTVAATTVQAAIAEAASEALQASAKGVANGVASLDGSGQVPLAQLGNAPSGGGGSTPVYGYTPVDYGWLAWTCDPLLGNVLGTPALGTPYWTRFNLPAAGTLTNTQIEVGAAGAGLAGAYFALKDSTGATVAITADVSTTLQSTGVKTIPFATPYSAAAGKYWVVMLISTGATTAPQLYKATTGVLAQVNQNLTAANSRAATSAAGQTTIPASVTPSTLTQGNLIWSIGIS